MRQTDKKILTVFLLIALAMLGGVPLAHSSLSTASDKSLAFIENVLPLDISRYSVTLRSYGVPELPDLGLTQPFHGEQEILTYDLKAEDSMLEVICTLQDDVLYSCNMYTMQGSVINDRQYSDVTDAAVSFLQKYQSNSKMDSTELITTLSKVDPTKNVTETSDNLKLTVTHQDLSGTWFGDSTDLRWVKTYSGCDYLSIAVSFQDGVFSGFIDYRQLYSIGDTTVKISEEQAKKISLEAIKTYSYSMSNDWIVTDFEVKEDEISANLQARIKDGNVFYPAWSVVLPLNGVYPGSVRELLVGIWAGSGEVYLVNHQAYGDANLPDTSASENGVASIDMGTIAIVAAVTTLVLIAVSAFLISKKRK